MTADLFPVLDAADRADVDTDAEVVLDHLRRAWDDLDDDRAYEVAA